MSLAQHLLYSSNSSLNAANLFFIRRSSRVMAFSKNAIVFRKTRQLKLILAENIGWPISRLKSCLNFRRYCQANPLQMRYQKKQAFFLFVTFRRYMCLSLLRTSSGSCSITVIILLLVLFKIIVIISFVKGLSICRLLFFCCVLYFVAEGVEALY